MNPTNTNWDRQRVWSQIEAKLDKKKKRRIFWWFFLGGMGISSLVIGFWLMTIESQQQNLGSTHRTTVSSKNSSNRSDKFKAQNITKSLDTQSQDAFDIKDQISVSQSKSPENKNDGRLVLKGSVVHDQTQNTQKSNTSSIERLLIQKVVDGSFKAAIEAVSNEELTSKAKSDPRLFEKTQDFEGVGAVRRDQLSLVPDQIRLPYPSLLHIRATDTIKFGLSSLDFIKPTLVACCNPYKRQMEVNAYAGSFSSRFRGSASYIDVRNQTERGNFHFGISAQLIQYLGKSFFVYGGLTGERIYSIYDHTISRSEVNTGVAENAVYYEFPDGAIWYEAGEVDITTTTTHRVIENNHVTRAYVPLGAGFVKDYHTWSLKSKIGFDLRWVQNFSGVLLIDGVHQRDKVITNPFHDSQAFDARLHLSTQVDFNISRGLRGSMGVAYARDQFLKSRESSAAYHFIHGQMGILFRLD